MTETRNKKLHVSDTPRTDALYVNIVHTLRSPDEAFHKMTEHAYALERELAEANRRLSYVDETLRAAHPGMDEGAPIEAVVRKVANALSNEQREHEQWVRDHQKQTDHDQREIADLRKVMRAADESNRLARIEVMDYAGRRFQDGLEAAATICEYRASKYGRDDQAEDEAAVCVALIRHFAVDDGEEYEQFERARAIRDAALAKNPNGLFHGNPTAQPPESGRYMEGTSAEPMHGTPTNSEFAERSASTQSVRPTESALKPDHPYTAREHAMADHIEEARAILALWLATETDPEDGEEYAEFMADFEYRIARFMESTIQSVNREI